MRATTMNRWALWTLIAAVFGTAFTTCSKAVAQGYDDRWVMSFVLGLGIFERLAPNSLGMALGLTGLTWLALAQNQPQKALQHSQHAIAIIETQRQNIQDPETRALFGET